MTLRKFSDLGTVHRNQPCQEYPGVWHVSLPSSCRIQDDTKYASFQEALAGANYAVNLLEKAKKEYDPRDITISWEASDNDPRIGQVWFTSFYVHSRLGIFGNWKET